MAIGRIPGPLGAHPVSGKPVRLPQPLGVASPQMKQMPVGVKEIIFYPPPRFEQGREFTKEKERTYGCWATAANMVMNWRNESQPFKRPPEFEKLVPGDDPDKKAAYLLFTQKCLLDWGFTPVKGATQMNWAPSDEDGDGLHTKRLASLLDKSGPVYCEGRFWPGGEGGAQSTAVGGLQHAIAVFGAQWDVVYYRDPWEGEIKKIGIEDFNDRLLKNFANDIMYVFEPNNRPHPGLGPRRRTERP